MSLVRALGFLCCFFFFSSRRRHTRLQGDWSSDVCSSDLDTRFLHVHQCGSIRSSGRAGTAVRHAKTFIWPVANATLSSFSRALMLIALASTLLRSSRRILHSQGLQRRTCSLATSGVSLSVS